LPGFDHVGGAGFVEALADVFEGDGHVEIEVVESDHPKHIVHLEGEGWGLKDSGLLRLTAWCP